MSDKVGAMRSYVVPQSQVEGLREKMCGVVPRSIFICTEGPYTVCAFHYHHICKEGARALDAYFENTKMGNPISVISQHICTKQVHCLLLNNIRPPL